jgi:hypothetical protein
LIYDDEGQSLFENPSHVEDAASRSAGSPPAPTEPNFGQAAAAPTEPNFGSPGMGPPAPNKANVRVSFDYGWIRQA